MERKLVAATLYLSSDSFSSECLYSVDLRGFHASKASGVTP
jgi:hypothetical protein